MPKLALKSLLFAALFLGAGTVLDTLVLRRASLDPGLQLFYAKEPRAYPLVVLGDSVFASRFVAREEQTLWAVLGRETGLPTLAAGLNGGRPGDLVSGARYLAAVLEPGSVVFIGIHPLKRWNEQGLEYADEFFQFGGYLSKDPGPLERAWNALGRPVVAMMYRWRARAVALSAGRQYFDAGQDRVWDRPGDWALERFRKVEAAFRAGDLAQPVDFGLLREVHAALAERRIAPIFVLTPLNGSEIARWAPPADGLALSSLLRGRHEELARFFRDNAYEFLDLFDALPAGAFADLIHTNAKGDALLAGAMARHLATPTASHPAGMPPATR